MEKQLIFEPISLNHSEKAESIRKRFGNNLYLYTFASLYAWREDEQYEICFADDAFIIKNGAVGDNAYLFPCGSDGGKKVLIDALLAYEKPTLCSLTDEDKDFLETYYPDMFEFEEIRDEFIYLFDRKAQVELKGKDYKKQRHQIHIGKNSAAQWSTEPLTQENTDRAIAINKEWVKKTGKNGLADIEAANCALKHFKELSMWGMLFKADGEDVAYVMGSFITPEIFDLAFCKVIGERRDFFVRWKVFSSLPQEVVTIDSEEDLGIEGLRINKLSRHPQKLIRIWKGNYKI